MVRRLRTLALAMVSTLASAGVWGAAAPAADAPRQVGPFEISRHVGRVGDNGRFLRTGNPFASRATANASTC